MSHALFDKVYVEKRASEDKVTGEILERLGNPSPEYIGHYKDLFDAYRPSEEIKVSGRGGVSSANESRSLILAHNPGKRLYEGAPVCQSFGNEHFYYSPCVMNCIYDCEYCFLKGMYPGRAICVFTDIDETFAELDEIEKEHDAYVCASYNTDLVALEDVTGYVEKWCSKTASDKKLTTEIRTKCSRTDIYGKLPISDRVIFAFTLSPDEIIRDYVTLLDLLYTNPDKTYGDIAGSIERSTAPVSETSEVPGEDTADSENQTDKKTVSLDDIIF